MPIISIFVMPFGLLAMLLMPLGLDRYPLLVMGAGLDWMISIAQMVASWGGEVTTGRIPQQAFLLIAAGGALACLFRTWLAISGLTIVAAGLVVISLSGMEQPDIVIAEERPSGRDDPAGAGFQQTGQSRRISCFHSGSALAAGGSSGAAAEARTGNCRCGRSGRQ